MLALALDCGGREGIGFTSAGFDGSLLLLLLVVGDFALVLLIVLVVRVGPAL